MAKLVPCTVKAAMRRVKQWHRHLPDVHAGLFAVAVADDDGEICGVGLAGTPCQEWEGTGRIVITRLAIDELKNGCSMVYGALCRAAKALGYREAWTYTLQHEPGTSLRAAGFEYMGMTDGGEHDRPSRRRRKAVNSEPKHRWRRRLAVSANEVKP